MTLCDGIPETSAAPNAKLCVCVIFAANDTQHTTHAHAQRKEMAICCGAVCVQLVVLLLLVHLSVILPPPLSSPASFLFAHAHTLNSQPQQQHCQDSSDTCMGNTQPTMSAQSIVSKALAENTVVVFSKTYCPFCTRVKAALKDKGIEFALIEMDVGEVSYGGESAEGADVHNVIKSQHGHRTVPAVFIKGKLLGGCDDTLAAISSGKIQQLIAA